MLIVALVLAVISLAALVTAVVTSNELIAWACIGLSAVGVMLLIVDAVRDRNRRPVDDLVPVDDIVPVAVLEDDDEEIVDYPSEPDGDYPDDDYPDEIVYDDPEHDEPSDDEPSSPIAAEEAAIHTISAEELAQAESDAEAEADVETHIEQDDSGSYTLVYSGEPADTETAADASSESTGDDSVIVIHSSETEPGQSES